MERFRGLTIYIATHPTFWIAAGAIILMVLLSIITYLNRSKNEPRPGEL